MAITVPLCFGAGLLAGCSPHEAEAGHVTRSDLIGDWRASGLCNSSLTLEKDGSAQVKRWPMDYTDGRITQRESGKATWTLDSSRGEQSFKVNTDSVIEPLMLLQDDGRLVLLQIPGRDPDNSIGCRFKRIDRQKFN
ncbi:hypothetical protein [Streptomyces yerevanensis]|uniref:hypothetical protein n=1 Tax=Streptomyces yerevanensis TaxID=66378 RepID=UPI00052712ED|nr:hypothetical protein [Streptomyces yerevanensis]